MCIVPVIDLLDGQVVHAIAGQRNQYAPFQKTRYQFSSAVDLCSQLIDEFQPEWVYVADLNAILGSGNNLVLIEEMTGLNTPILLDFGISTADDFGQLLSCIPRGASAQTWIPVIGSESIKSWAEFRSIQKEIGNELVFSIDLKEQKILGPAFSEVTLPDLLNLISDSGISDVVVLDLDSVGTQSNRFQILAQTIAPTDLPFRVFAGGGVKDKADLKLLSDLGFSGAFVSSAIHQGKITVLN